MTERVFSAPGRVEIGGNHTDHQRGRVLAAAIDLDMKCTAKTNGTDIVCITSEGFGSAKVDLTDLKPREDEKATMAALIRGVAAWLYRNGHAVGGFNSLVRSDVPEGAGLSSSAAFEVLIGNVFKGLFNINISPLDIALAGQFAENNYFGKPCGLMDQSASSFGGLTMMDFFDPQKPMIKSIKTDFSGYALCVVTTGDSHSDLTEDYAAIPFEMKAIAAYFGKEDLREVDVNEFYSSIADLRKINEFNSSIADSRKINDRGILRAIHFFGENERVKQQAAALESGNISEFMLLVTESGRSSLAYLQSIYSISNYKEQGLTLALALAGRILDKHGAYRVHGGGFAGSILAFVPDGLKDDFERQMSAVFGKSCCHYLNIRAEGGREI